MASPPEDKTLYIKPVNLASLTVTYTGSNAGTFTLTNFRTTTYNGETYLALTREVGITSGIISAPGYFGTTFSLPDGVNECFVELKQLGGSLYAWTSVDDSSKTIYTTSETPTNSDNLYDNIGNIIADDYLNDIRSNSGDYDYANIGYGRTSLAGWTISSSSLSFSGSYERS